MKGTVPASPIRGVIERWYEKHRDLRELEGPGSILLSNLAQVVQETGLSKSFLLALMNGRRESIGFDAADAIVMRLGCGWAETAELWSIYLNFDLGTLDAKQPCKIAPGSLTSETQHSVGDNGGAGLTEKAAA